MTNFDKTDLIDGFRPNMLKCAIWSEKNSSDFDDLDLLFKVTKKKNSSDFGDFDLIFKVTKYLMMLK